MNDHASVIQSSAVAFALVVGISTVVYAILIWIALRKKDFVKATIWHRKSGFSIEARGDRRKKG
jgi:hypothetical protein